MARRRLHRTRPSRGGAPHGHVSRKPENADCGRQRENADCGRQRENADSGDNEVAADSHLMSARQATASARQSKARMGGARMLPVGIEALDPYRCLLWNLRRLLSSDTVNSQ